jgi:hypothetical protein
LVAHGYNIFAAIYDDLHTAPTVPVLDDLHWADQGTIDLLRFVLRLCHFACKYPTSRNRGTAISVPVRRCRKTALQAAMPVPEQRADASRDYRCRRPPRQA